MGAGHSTPGGLLSAPRSLLRSHQRARQPQRDADNILSPQLYNSRVHDAENNNLASLVSSVSDSMVEFVNVEGEVGVPSTRPPPLHVVPPAPQLHRLFTEHNVASSSLSSPASPPSLPTLARAEEDEPVHLGLTMDGVYTANIPVEAAFVGSPGRLPTGNHTLYVNGEFIPPRQAEESRWITSALAVAATVGLSLGVAFGFSYLASKSTAAAASA